MMKQPSRSSIAAAILAVAWIFLVVFNYYIVHKPFGIENALAILNALGDMIVAGALVVLSAAVGRRVTTRVVTTIAGGIADQGPVTILVLQTGLGMGLVSFATLALGVAGMLLPVVFWAGLAGLLIILRSDVRSLWRDLRSLEFPVADRFERGLALFVGLGLVVAFLFAMTPPTAWDAQTYHLVEAKQALARGRIAAPPDILYFSFPSLVEMLFLAGMVLKGDIPAQLLHFTYLCLTLGALYALAARYFNSRVAWLSCAILVATPSLLSVATFAYVDLALVFYALAALYALLIARERGETSWFAVAGAMAGLSMGVKYTAAIIPVALLIVLLLSPDARRRSHVVALVAAAAVFAAPWYLRNLAFTGNPVYPFLFGGAFWDGFRAEWFSRFGSGLVSAPLQLVTVPWDVTIYGQEGSLGFEATIGPTLLALIPLLLLMLLPGIRRNGDKESLREPMIFVLVLYLFWLLGIAGSRLLWQTRLLFPAFPVLALAAAVAFDRLQAFDMPAFSLQRFARLVLLLILGVTALQYVLRFAGSDTLAYLSGAETREAFLARNLGPYQSAVRYINEHVPENARMLFLWEPRSYYVRRDVQPDAILDTFAHLRWQYRDADRIGAALKEAGYTHIVLSRAGLDYELNSGYDPITTEDVRVLTSLVAQHFRQVYGNRPLEIVARNGRPGVLDAESEPYAIYESAGPGAY